MPTNEELKRRLKQAGITRAAVAEATGSSLSTVTNWLSAGRPIPPHKMKQIERLLNAGPVPYHAVMSFAVRLTRDEWEMLKQAAGVEQLDAESAEVAVRQLLQETWKRLANSQRAE